MTLANPAGLWLLALALPIVALHVLRPRRTARVVSSTFLWRDIAEPVSAAAPWQRLRPSVLLLLQLLAVALLAGAVARPVRLTPGDLARHTVFVIDASGSMAALDGDPDRVGAAVARARSLRDQLPAGGLASVVVASERPRVLLSASPDRKAFDEAVGVVRAGAGGADWAGAFALAASLETPEAPLGVVLLSDGRLEASDVGLAPAGTRYERIGDRATNRAITRLTVEPRGSGLAALVTVRNTGGGGARQLLRVDVDGRTEATLDVDLPPGALVEQEVELPAGDRVEAFLEGEDLLDADDDLRAVAGRRQALRVLLVGEEDIFLDQLLGAIPGLSVERVPTAESADGFDLAVFDGVAVPERPGAPVLVIAPPGGAVGVGVSGMVDRPAVTLVRNDLDVLSGIDLSGVAIASAQRLEPRPGDEVLVASEGTPLLVRGRRDGLPFAYLGFALDESDLGLQVAFPILADRLLNELAGAVLAPGGLTVGDPLPVAGAGGAAVAAPGGTAIDVAPGGAAPVADRPGFWVVAEPGRPERTIAVNPDPAESELAPASSLPIEVRPATDRAATVPGQVSLLRWVAAVLLLSLVAEAFVVRRRMGVGRRQGRAALVLRGAVALLVIGALLGVELPRVRHRVATVFLIDASASLGSAGRADAVRWVRDALADQPSGALAGVALFGGDARLELTVQERATLVATAVQVDSERTDLAGALRLAAAVLPSDARRRVVIVSDGRATKGDAAGEARRLASEGIQVDTHLVARSGGADAAVTEVVAPTVAREGDAITFSTTITATGPGPAAVTLLLDGTTVAEALVDLVAGDNQVALTHQAGPSGLERYQVEVAFAADTVAENDRAFAGVQVEGPATVLLVEGSPGEAATLQVALEAGGLMTRRVAPEALPAVDVLATHSATVLVDVDARSLSKAQTADLAVATRDLGRGLVVLGGDRSYALGGYLESELEQLLPVVSEVQDPLRRQSVAQVLAIDASGSMGACHCAEGNNGLAGGGNMGFGGGEGGVNKTDISRAAAARTIEALAASDEIGVLAFNTEQRWMIDLQQLPSEEVVRKGLGRLRPEGGTKLNGSLETSAAALRASDASLKHIILFTDGFTAEEALDDLVAQAAALREEGITVSVLATGEGSSLELERVAEAGGGRFHPGRDLEQIPQLMVEESVLASRSFVNEGEFRPEIVGSGAAVDGLDAAPPLFGFIATTAKPAARTLLRIGEERDPLLATWQAGLGRATAWTSDASDTWSQAWADWDGYVPFWTTVVKDVFATGEGTGAARTVLDGERLRITVESEGAWPDGATAVARVAGPDRAGQEVRLERLSSTTFGAEVPATAAGAYAVGTAVTGPGGEVLLAGATVATQSYSPEHRLGPAEPEVLAELAEITGGRAEIDPGQAFDASGLVPGRGHVPLAGWLLLAAALLWPLAVALSRLSLTTATPVVSRAAGTLRRRLPSLPPRPGRERAVTPPARQMPTPPPLAPPPPADAPPPTTIGRLLDRKREGKGR
ncbi:MAG: VWA domain-containing protein [Acidimicrobiales bacterium]